MSCLLCLKKKSNQIKIYSKKGRELNISFIVGKHFWFQLSADKNSKESLCLVCWNIVNDFHKFYLTVADAHNFFEAEVADLNTTEQKVTDPLPKTEHESIDLPADQLFDTEVKLEINDLDLLPETEVIENTFKPSERELRATKRKQQQTQSLSKKTILNRSVKKESSYQSDIDSENEIPLSMLLHSDAKTENFTTLVDLEMSKAENDLVILENKQQNSVFKTIIKDSKTIESFPQDISVNAEESPLHEFTSIENNTYDSISLSNEKQDSDSDGLNNFESQEQFAIIGPQRKPVKPKKYKKRTKPLVPPKRMTKEEIELRRLQQEKYDEIIAKLFDKFPCPKCNLFVRNFGDMRSHFNTSHNGRGPSVECCGRKFTMRKSLADHVLVHINPEHFKCMKCNQVFRDSCSLKEHEESHDLSPDQIKAKKTFDCNICSKKLSTKDSLKKHLLVKHAPKSEYEFACTECDKKFPLKDLLKRHIKKAHGEEKGIICEKCGKTVQNRYHLKKHIESEHSNVPRPEPARFQCKICGIWLKSLYTLKEHTQYLHDQSQVEHRCQICGYLSSNARSLKKHISFNHKLERKFKCTLCEKAFKRPNDLREHISTHTGEVLYTCSICSMTFFCKANYHKHKQRRHGYQPARRTIIGLKSKREKKTGETQKQMEHITSFTSDVNSTQNPSALMTIEEQYMENV